MECAYNGCKYTKKPTAKANFWAMLIPLPCIYARLFWLLRHVNAPLVCGLIHDALTTRKVL